jgi:hypothetical protein
MARLDGLSLRADELARLDPTRWNAFLAELRQYSAFQTTACVNAPPDGVQVAQGAARQCATLLELLENAVKTADQIHKAGSRK